MFRGKNVSSNSADTVIGAGIIIEGTKVTGAGMFCVEGKLSGTIDITGRVLLGQSGTIEGDIHADSAMLSGEFTGNLFISNTLHLTSTAVVTGEVTSGKMIVDEGAVLSGTCSVGTDSSDKGVLIPHDEVRERYENVLSHDGKGSLDKAAKGKVG